MPASDVKTDMTSGKVNDALRDVALRKRRQFLLQAVAALTVGGIGVYEGKFEKDNLEVVRTDVHLPNWPQEADGITIGLISDFHADYDRALLRTLRAAEMLHAEKPDMVFLGGDYVTHQSDRSWLEPTISALTLLHDAPLGAFAIMGNHDWWGSNAYLATYLLRKAGFNVLNNASVRISGVADTYVVGLDDPWCDKMNIDEALLNVPKNAKKIVAVHEPDYADVLGSGFDLQLSGHSHGGQICLPFLPPLHGPAHGRIYPRGLQQAENHLVYTTRGIGMVGPQVRTFCAPEVTILTIRTVHAS